MATLQVPAPIGFGRYTRDESAVDETADHDRDRALMSRRPLGELIQRVRRLVGQLLQHKKLGETDAQLAFDAARVEAECPNDAADRIHGAGDVVGGSHGSIEWGINVSNLVAPERAKQG